eukprot:7456088-Alexandrium_andersonii.AAC.1
MKSRSSTATSAEDSNIQTFPTRLQIRPQGIVWMWGTMFARSPSLLAIQGIPGLVWGHIRVADMV